MSKLNKDIKIYLELYGPQTIDQLHLFAKATGQPLGSTKLEKILQKDKEIINLGYIEKKEISNAELDALVKFGNKYLASNWYLHPYYFSKRNKSFTRAASQVYQAHGLDKLLKGS